VDESNFIEVLTRAVELADGEDGWHDCEVGDPARPEVRIPSQSLRTELHTYEGSHYRVVIIGPIDN
jgi:hypothetical protein